MTKREFPNYDPKDVKEWLVKVFGTEILFESQQSLGVAKRATRSSDDPSAWQIYYSGEIYLRADLPPLLTPCFVQSLRNRLAIAISKTIDPLAFRLSSTQLLSSDWPLPAEVIRDDLTLDTEKLRILAERLAESAEWTGNIVKEILTHEAAWIERKRSVAALCDELFLGYSTGSAKQAAYNFRYDTKSGNPREVELAFVLSNYDCPMPGSGYETIRLWEERNLALGLEGMLAFVDFQVGTHAPIIEYKFALYGHSDTEIANKLERLRRPETLPIVRQYIHEVIAATLIHHWFGTDTHPDFHHQLQTICSDLSGDRTQAAGEERDRRRKILENEPKYREWAEIFPKLADEYPTTGEFVRAIYQEPPAGQEATYLRLRRWTEETFPLLKAHLDATPVPARPPTPGSDQGEVPRDTLG